MNHAELVERAKRWLYNSCRVQRGWADSRLGRFDGKPMIESVPINLVISEKASACVEIPDAIGFGWNSNCTVLLECKSSRSDFHVDRKKMFRAHPKHGMGRYRYYFAPKGLLRADEMPGNWGLLEVCGRVVRVRRFALPYDEFNRESERLLIYAEALSMRRELDERILQDVG